MMSIENNSYKKIFNATAFLGGVQFFIIITSILRSKLVSVIFGAYGIGVIGLITSSTAFISALTGFGLGTSAVKNISIESVATDKNRLVIIVNVIRRLALFTGAIGFIITLLFSSWLSEINFNNSSFTFSFILVSFSLLFSQLTVAENVILQGLSEYKSFAKSNLYSSVFSLLVTSPLYYYGGTDFIAVGILLTSIITFTFAKFQTSKFENIKSEINIRINYFGEGKEILFLGFFLGLTGLINLGFSSLLRIFIGKYGGIEIVGLYSAGFAIINTYVGMIFSAMGTDYYPRLSKLVFDHTKTNDCINKQMEVALVILFPIIIFFLVFSKYIINLLYSSNFILAEEMVQYASLGILFKASSWSIAYLFLAKNNKKIFFWNELISELYMFGLNLICFYYFSLTGLGISFLIGYVLYFLQVYIFAKKYHSFLLEMKNIKKYLFIIIFSAITFILMRFIPNPYNMCLSFIMFLFSIMFSWKFFRAVY
jgi:O-antigen/teichoic acid export membrane protein